jgi:hypothetical protein
LIISQSHRLTLRIVGRHIISESNARSWILVASAKRWVQAHSDYLTQDLIIFYRESANVNGSVPLLNRELLKIRTQLGVRGAIDSTRIHSHEF